MKTALICHEDALLDREGLVRWLGSFSEVKGVLVLREKRKRLWKRIRHELRRSGVLGLLDVFAFRIYSRIRLRARDSAQEAALFDRLLAVDPPLSTAPVEKIVASPNSPEAADFLASAAPDILVARCKTLLRPEIFSLARQGAFAFHPGICPEYRNAHGCFWALAQGDLGNVGMTLLKIDAGVDTGPIYGQFRVPFQERAESAHLIQLRSVFENLAPLRAALESFHAGNAQPLDVAGRASATWGQPRLSTYLRWQRAARQRALEK